MAKQFDLEILHHILSQFSGNVMQDCCRIIEKLLKSLNDPTFNDVITFQNTVFASINVLLQLYEKLQQEKRDNLHQLVLPVHLLIHNIQLALQCNSDHCRIPYTDAQCNILSIISLLFKNSLLQNHSRDLEELIKLYNGTLIYLHNRGDTKECKTDCLIFKLKILNSVYHALNKFAPSDAEFNEVLKSINNLEECKLFSELVLCQNDDVAIQTLMYLIPEYINFFKSGKIIKVIWKMISDSMRDSTIDSFRSLTVLCKIFDFCFEESRESNDTKNLTLFLLEDSNYWKLVQMALVEEDPLKRKQGLYLLKKTVDILNNTDKSIECSKETVFFYWHKNCKDELYEIYSEIIVILEFLEEQQVHIIKPIFGMIKKLGQKIMEYEKVSFSWVLLIYKKTLMHESMQIVKWGLKSLLELSKDSFSHEYIVKETVTLLTSSLNNTTLYYSIDWTITYDLKTFFYEILPLKSSKTFFSLFTKNLCHQVWSAEALFFVIHSLSLINDYGCHEVLLFWGKEEISHLKEFVSKAFITHNKIIRIGVQCNLLKLISDFTDHTDVPLENLILLISRLSLREIKAFGANAWDNFTSWLSSSYPKQEFYKVLQKYKEGELEKEFNEKCASLTITLFIYCYVCIADMQDPFFDMGEQSLKILSGNYLQEILVSFKEIDKRLYCNKSLQDQYLLIIINIYESNVSNSMLELINCTIPFVRDLILYIQTQLQQISGLQDFNSCQFYLNAFGVIIKTFVASKSLNEYVVDFYIKLLKDFEVTCMKSDVASIKVYYKLKLLSTVLELYPVNPESSFLDTYLLKEVNKPLRKDDEYSKQTRDSQTLWGKMNSEFLEGKWRILESLINKKIIIPGPMNVEGTVWIRDDDLINLCLGALSTGGYGVLVPVMSVLKNLIPVLNDNLILRNIVESVWKVISERRKTEEFKSFIRHFVEMLFQESLILKGDFAQEILLEYADVIFSDSSLTVINILMKHIQQLNIPDISITLFCHVIGKGLLFGPLQKKDEKLTNKVCGRINNLKICDARKIGDFNLSQEIRARAVQKILMLDKNSETHKTAAKNLIDTLLKMESEINKNRVRYFGDSHTHRVKHRLMQALLLLEPIFDENEKPAVELSNWLLNCLVRENSQPSIRVMQEWLLIRMILRHSSVYSRFGIYNFYRDMEVSKKSICSLIVVTFHMCRLSRSDIREYRIPSEMCNFFSFFLHQNFEVRLFAQVVFLRLYNFAKDLKLGRVTEEFEHINQVLINTLSDHTKGNFSKNLSKLLHYFFISDFEPLEHYSLETIFMDLPRLTNAGEDERISSSVFKYCGVESYKMDIPLRDNSGSLKYVKNSECFAGENYDVSGVTTDHKSEDILENYQKKIIPDKLLIPSWDENGSAQQCTVKKDGLIVVASLIDRIPNLGGLARTCEIFGASEYVVNSLGCTKDKQFTCLSVTAEKWIPVKEVKTQNLLDYILEMKQRGYTVIGAEQALRSLSLSAVKFPKKSLLLLGNEKEGIPPNFLPLLDICVEIPQLGIIRSLNVHVTGALFIWEYAKQNLFDK